MKKKYILVLGILLFVFVVLSGCTKAKEAEKPAEPAVVETPTVAVGEKIIMKISHPAAPDTERDFGAQKIKEIVESKTNGQVEVQIYPSGQLGGQRDQVEGVQFGSIECSIIPTAYLGSTVPMITLLDTPYLLPTDPDDLTELYKTDSVKKLLDKSLAKGIITLDIWQTGYKQWSANKPVLYPEDMKGMKVRVMNSPIIFKQAEVLGVTGVTMDFGETYAALQNKAIDGQENPIPLIYDSKFHEVQSDITITNHSGLDQLVIVNKAWFESLNPDIQNAIIEGVSQGGTLCKEKTLEKIEEYTQKILQTGKTNISYLNDEQLNAWKEALKPVQEFARTSQGEEGAEIFDAIQAEANRIIGE